MEDLSEYNPIGSDLRKGQLRILEIAKEFDSICHKHNVTYWLMSGTLLGARRHGGFIPWDDDFDVGVEKKDYQRLLNCLEKELPENYKLQTRKTDSNYKHCFAKIRDLNSEIEENCTIEFGYKFNGLFIDIFPFEQICINEKIKKPLDCRYSELKYKFKKGILWQLISKLVYYISSLVVFGLRFIGLFIVNRFSHAYGTGFYAPHKLATCFPVRKIKFEDFEFNAPNDVDQYLIDEYGDFMALPSREKRVNHSNKIKILDQIR
ncbi:phosphorylcholine transferase LicD [Flavobacterium sp. DG2-3]|uniref:LicD family protein n=1 Tax=Flavobacterium sp. DG2-3 TaxID=3068317 RepID=UPI00273DD45D|nr:LicD family protein [Flavobacterium sp. DG2-3]MDP5199625.1 LicD family protein [Flavobacterium sp. DG2-3]